MKWRLPLYVGRASLWEIMPNSHTYKQTHTRTYTHIENHTDTQEHIYRQTHILQRHTHYHKDTRTYTQASTHRETHRYTYTHAHIPTERHEYAHRHSRRTNTYRPEYTKKYKEKLLGPPWNKILEGVLSNIRLKELCFLQLRQLGRKKKLF